MSPSGDIFLSPKGKPPGGVNQLFNSKKGGRGDMTECILAGICGVVVCRLDNNLDGCLYVFKSMVCTCLTCGRRKECYQISRDPKLKWIWICAGCLGVNRKEEKGDCVLSDICIGYDPKICFREYHVKTKCSPVVLSADRDFIIPRRRLASGLVAAVNP